MCKDDDNLMQKVIALNFTEEDLRFKGNAVDVKVCPNCGRRWKLNINVDKQCFRCPACDFSGNAITLHAKINSLSYEKAKYELGIAKPKPMKKVFNSVKKVQMIESEVIRSMIYGSIVLHTSLTEEHRKNLLDRGLEEKELMWYSSCVKIPKDVGKEFIKMSGLIFLDEEKNYEFRGLPGLYGDVYYNKDSAIEDHSHILINLPADGFLIPIVNHEDDLPRLSCFQIRRDNQESTSRYQYLTSIGKKNGLSVQNCKKIHFTSNFWSDGKMEIPEAVYLTEGSLKADVAASLSHWKFISIPGVNSLKGLFEELIFLRERGCKKINVCLDMDYQTNPNVQHALEKIKSTIEKTNLVYKQCVWDAKYKGIDDYLLARKKASTKQLEN